MDVIIVMCLGVLVGKFFFPVRWKRINEILQTVCTVLLIFSMGVMLGSREDFVREITVLGSQSIIFFPVSYTHLEINGSGTSEELLKTNAIYREVYESQVKGGADDE